MTIERFEKIEKIKKQMEELKHFIPLLSNKDNFVRIEVKNINDFYFSEILNLNINDDILSDIINILKRKLENLQNEFELL